MTASNNEHLELATDHVGRARATLQLLNIALETAAPAIRESIKAAIVDLNTAEECLYNVGLEIAR